MDRELPSWLDGGSDHQGPLPEVRPPLGGRWAVVAVAGGVAAATVIAAAVLVLTGSRHAPQAAVKTAVPAVRTVPQPAAGPLPFPLLIGDEGDQRVVEVAPDRHVMWQRSGAASSAEFSPHGRRVVLTGTDPGTVSIVDYRTKQTQWVYQNLNGPYGAHLLPDGNVIVPDVRNCRILTLTPAPAVAATWGTAQNAYCQTDLTMNQFSYPNGAVPQSDGNVLVTLSGSSSVALFAPDGTVLWSVNSPSLYGDIASAAELTPDGHILVAAMGTPGTLLSFDPKTRAVYWGYHATSGAGELADPRQAILLPNGNLAVADTGNNRVVVVDPKTSQIVWTYGGTGVLKHPTSVAVDRWHAPTAGSTQ